MHRLFRLSRSVTVAAAALPLAAMTGCAGYHNHSGLPTSCEWCAGGYDTPLCFGYHSTCWRPWPEECPTCPPFTLPPPAEQVLPGAPMAEPPTVEPAPPTPQPEAAPPQPLLPPMPAPATNLPPANPGPMPPPAPRLEPPPAAPPAGPGAFDGAQYLPLEGDAGMLRRRWVEGGFVSQAGATEPAETLAPITPARPENR
jgi:hypothetical protein